MSDNDQANVSGNAAAGGQQQEYIKLKVIGQV